MVVSELVLTPDVKEPNALPRRGEEEEMENDAHSRSHCASGFPALFGQLHTQENQSTPP